MGDFSAHFHRPESGIHTVEGNVAGARAALLTKQRQEQQEQFESKRNKIVHDQKKASQSMHDKFAHDSSLSQEEREFRRKTVGLVTAEDFQRAAAETRKGVVPATEDVTTQTNELSAEELQKRLKAEKKARKRKLKQKRKAMSTLSFANEEGEEGLLFEEEEETAETPPAVVKDPTVNTSFLPDKQRDQTLERQRLELQKKWQEQQLLQKQQPLEIVYSYWDGSGHRRKVAVKKGDTIGTFLSLVKRELQQEFREVYNISSEELLYVKEDLILPHDLTFYDLIATKARGKSGPLFHFDVHEDIRVDAINVNIEKDESHPGKVVERKWYERNKHIFPASRWEVFDPSKTYGTYTIHGGEVTKKKKIVK